MLNPFPELLAYGIIAPMIIRVAVCAAFFYLAVQHFRTRNESTELLSPMVGSLSSVAGPALALTECMVGLLLVVGAWTQVAALIAIAICIKSFLFKMGRQTLFPLPRSTYVLLLVMSISLLLSGAGGPFGFDLPL